MQVYCADKMLIFSRYCAIYIIEVECEILAAQTANEDSDTLADDHTRSFFLCPKIQDNKLLQFA